jgi:hypothetical protein
MSAGDAGRGLVRQGDLLLVPVGGLPDNARRLGSGRLVLAEGEATGHAHVVEDERASLFDWHWGADTYLVVEGVDPVVLWHEEHDPLPLRPGVYEVRRQREYVPQRRARWVAD